MNEINDLHKKAMSLTQQAFNAKDKGDNKLALDLFRQAFNYESAAAMHLYYSLEIEPTRSVLFRSAGWLAFNAGDYDMAQNMVDFALENPNAKDEVEELQNAISKTKRTIKKATIEPKVFKIKKVREKVLV